MQFAPYIGVGRAGAGIDARHPSITHCGENHRDHRDQDGGDHVSSAGVAENAVGGHGRGGLDHDDAVQNQVPKRQRSAKPGSGGGRSNGREWLPFPRIGLCRVQRCQLLKRFRTSFTSQRHRRAQRTTEGSVILSGVESFAMRMTQRSRRPLRAETSLGTGAFSSQAWKIHASTRPLNYRGPSTS